MTIDEQRRPGSAMMTNNDNERTRRRKTTTTTMTYAIALAFVLYLCEASLSFVSSSPLPVSGPRLLSSAYSLRRLHVGTVQHDATSSSSSSSNNDDKFSNDDKLSSNATEAKGYELSWQRYEFATIDMVFDQPLYITSDESIKYRRHKRDASSTSSTSSPNSGHHPVHSTPPSTPSPSPSHPTLDGSISVECAGVDGSSSSKFVLSNDWSSSESHNDGIDVAHDSHSTIDYWSSPRSALLPLFSSRNRFQSTLTRLFDADADPTSRVHKRSGHERSGLFDSRRASTAAIVADVVGRPNVLSLMVMITYESEHESREFLRIDHDDDHDRIDAFGNVRDRSSSPLGHCAIRYESIDERQRDLRATYDRSHQHHAAHPIVNDAQHTADDAERNTFDAKLGQLGGITNFKGYELVGTSSPLTLHPSSSPSSPSLFVTRTLIRVADGVDADFNDELRDMDDAMIESNDNNELYSHSPLDPASTLPSSSSLPLSSDVDPILLDLSTGAQYVGMMLKPICHGVMKPATRGATDLMLDDLMTILGNNLFYSVVDELGPDMNIMLGLTLGANLTNILQDSLTFSITRSIVQAVTDNVAPYVSKRLIMSVPSPLHTVIHAILEQNIPKRLERTLPVIFTRVLGLTLTHSLTRSIPHVVVPAIAHSLGLGHMGSVSRPQYYHEICVKCYMQSTGRARGVKMSPPDKNPSGYDEQGATKSGSECGACPTSAYSMYYGFYHAAYYTDYYGEYYAEYYSQAMQAVDKVMYAAEKAGGM